MHHTDLLGFIVAIVFHCTGDNIVVAYEVVAGADNGWVVDLDLQLLHYV